MVIKSVLLAFLWALKGLAEEPVAGPVVYKAESSSSILGGHAALSLKSFSFSDTGFGAAESSLFIDNGTIIYSPAFSLAGVGYATSEDSGKSWSQVLPGGSKQPRVQPVFRIWDHRFFFWSSNAPGSLLSYSDDRGKTWTSLGKHKFPSVSDWAKMVGGKPVFSKLKAGVSQVLYFSGPSPISTPTGILNPSKQAFWKSLDKGTTWASTKGAPSLKPKQQVEGGCTELTTSTRDKEMIIWGDGLVRANGTLIYGIRRCRKLTLAISDDEGDTWRFKDIPGSELTPYTDLLSYYKNGNVLVADPISEDINGNIYAVWVDPKYTLRMSISRDGGSSWSATSMVVGAPIRGVAGKSLFAYHPKLVHHPKTAGRAGLAYYGSADEGRSWDAYIAESANLLTSSASPVFSSLLVNSPSMRMQTGNKVGIWDQGYSNPFWDLVEFSGLAYNPENDDLVAAFARKMCTEPLTDVKKYKQDSCDPGWNFKEKASSVWQGYVAIAHH